jgi:hypothetical protein
MNHTNSMVNVADAGPSTSWLFSMDRLENTPSRRAKMSQDEENKRRRESIKMIRDIGVEMKL